MKNSILVLIIVCTVLLGACSLPQGFVPTQTVEPGPPQAPTATATISLPTITPEPTATPTLAPTATLQVYTQKQIQVTVDVLNMRAGPGAVFDIVKRITKGSLLWILGRAKGDDWLLVRDEANQAGWVSRTFIEYTGSLLDIPLFMPTAALTITGRIIDQKQQPVPGVDLAVMKGMGSDAVRMDVYSDSEGQFYAYLPDDTTGAWTIEIVGIMCTSPIMDANCKYSGKFSTDAFTIMVPDDVDIPLIFSYTP